MSRSEPWCPSCAIAMTSRLHEGRTIWWCSRCQGAFLPAEQLHEIAVDEALPRSRSERLTELSAAARGPLEMERQAPPTPCPWCTREMDRARYDGESAILVDRCESGCGIWLDGGELARVEAWTEAQRAGMIPLPTFESR